MSRKRKQKPARDPLCVAFDQAEEEFGEHKSTEFLLQIVSDRTGASVEAIADSLYGEADKEP